MPKDGFAYMPQNRNTFVEVEFQTPQNRVITGAVARHMGSHYPLGDVPVVNVTHVIRTATGKMLLTVGDTRSLSASQQGACILNLHKSIRVFET